jgi:RNA polymerase sigma-70 factor (ECF subfamily)
MSRVHSIFPARPLGWQQAPLTQRIQPRALFFARATRDETAADNAAPDATSSGLPTPRTTMPAVAAPEKNIFDSLETTPVLDAGEGVAGETEEETEAPAEIESTVDPAKAAFLQVLTRAKEGDRKAFEEIYQLYHRRIYNAVYGMLGDADDAQDVTQDVFIRLHYALPTLRADEAFSTYLYRIALNLCRDRARRKKRVRFQSIDTPRAGEDGDVEPMDFPDNAKLPEEKMTNDELQTRVREAVKTLSHDHKTVIMMHHFQGMEVNDIARILDIPTGTVKSRLARGRDQLHRKLRGYLLP